jgi:hypothetical protein
MSASTVIPDRLTFAIVISREPLRREGKIVNADCCILGMNRFVPRESGREGGR